MAKCHSYTQSVSIKAGNWRDDEQINQMQKTFPLQNTYCSAPLGQYTS
ncbi:hypothetical protein [Nafulsella turpanensis]|nr:hypothetical protein [Nafulsella turpanensis]